MNEPTMPSGEPLTSVSPVVAIREGIVFPTTENVLLFGRDKSIQAVQAAFASDSKNIILLMQKNPGTDNPTGADLYTIGVLATVKKIFRGDKGEVTALMHGVARVKISKYIQEEPYIFAEYEDVVQNIDETQEIIALMNHIHHELKKAINLGKGVDIVYLMNIMNGGSAYLFCEQVAMILDLKVDERQKLLEVTDLKRRLEMEAIFVTREVKVLELERNIHSKTQKKFEKGMKDAVLREKLKTIEQELGGQESQEDKEIDDLEKQIKKAKLPKDVLKKAMKELDRLARMSPYNPEASYIRTYIETIIELPWTKSSKGILDLQKAENVLDADHYGLKKVKERILEYLAVMRLKQDISGKLSGTGVKKDTKQPTIICFAGPPGVGKTSLGKSIAKSLGRTFVKVSLGGIRDEAEIRGHRRTYVGALPGRMIQGIKQAGTKNPVFMLDEIDKIGADYRGDPSAALLEALDPEQNHAFSDHYLELPFDLSDVLFIATANMLDTIPSALRDRLEIIHFAGYTDDEKFHIARDYLVTKQIEAHGLAKSKVTISDDALMLIIRRYTREAGVRELERQIAKVFRKIAREVVTTKVKSKKVSDSDIHGYLGAAKYSDQLIELEDSIGISTGLAWTPVGGDILFIEVAIMPGKGRLTLTGQLGDVMKESCQAALSYIRSRHELFGLEEGFYEKIDIHVHVPEGATPKDGPSAGLAITTAMVSALTKLPVNRLVGMTGEITLRGRALEIGGVKEKIIAAHRAGLKTIIMPKDNEKNLEDVPDFVKKELKFIFVDHMDDVVKNAFVFPKKDFTFASHVKGLQHN